MVLIEVIGMERDTYLYKARRKCQVIAHIVFSDEAMSKFYYRIVLHKKLNLQNPKRLMKRFNG